MRQPLRPWAVLLLASSHDLVLSTLASPVNVASAGRAVAVDPDYGYWDITFTSSSAASGYRWEDVYANDSRAAGTTIHCHQLYNVTVGVTTRTCDDTSFGYDLTGSQGQQCKFATLGNASVSVLARYNYGDNGLIVFFCPRHYRTSNCQG